MRRAPYLGKLEALGWLDLLEESPLVAGDCRFIREFFLPARGRYRRAEYLALAGLPNSGKADGLAERGRIARILGDAPEARRCFEKALTLDSDCAAARAFSAELDLVSNPRGALEGLEAAIRLDPDQTAYAVWKAYALLLMGEVPAVLRLLEGPSLTTGRILRGIVNEREGRLEAAERDFDAAVGAAPRSPGLYTLRGTVRYKLGRRAEAVEDAHQGLLLHPENLDTFVRILYLSCGRKTPDDPEEGHRLLLEAADQVIAGDPGQAWAWAARAGVLGKSRLQLDSLRKAVSLEPRRAWMHAFLGRALGGDDGDGHVEPKALRESLKELRLAAKLAPDSGWIRSWSAEVLKKLGRPPAQALAELDAGIALDPDYRLAFAWRCAAREAAKDDAGAVADISKCLEALDRPSFRHRRAALEWRLGKPTQRLLEDISLCMAKGTRYGFHYGGLNEGFPGAAKPIGLIALEPERVIALARKLPASALAKAWLGRTRLTAGDSTGALAVLDAALALDPRCWPALAWRGELHCRAGRFDKALADLDAAAKLQPACAVALLWRAVALFAVGRKAEASLDVARAGAGGPADAASARAWSLWAIPRFIGEKHEVKG